MLKSVPLFKDGDPVFLEQIIMALKPRQVAAGDLIVTNGDICHELYLVEQGEVEVLDDRDVVIKVLTDGDVFGEVGVLRSMPRNANVRAKIASDLYVLEKADFHRILRDNPQFAAAIQQVAKERYGINVHAEQLALGAGPELQQVIWRKRDAVCRRGAR